MAIGGSRRGFGAHEITFESFGVGVRLQAATADELERITAVLPPGARPSDGCNVDFTFALREASPGSYELARDGEILVDDLSLDVAIWWLGRDLSDLIAFRAAEHIFVHAGAVAHKGKAIVLPGKSHAGKTTLVAALVRAGAIYLSDEFAPIDAAGLVHPYARPLSIRDESAAQVDHDVASLGGAAGVEPVPVGLVAVTSYREGRAWEPTRISSGDGVLALMANAVPARTRPEATLHALSRCIDGALVLASDRGEADAVAPLLLAALDRD
jgi:hypothetical protein